MPLDHPEQDSARKASFATTIRSSDEQPTEDTPLLERKRSRAEVLWHKSTVYRVLLTGFLVSLSFGVTQVPLIYVFGVMTCDEYYKTHAWPPPGAAAGIGLHDRCRVHEIEAGTARAVALLSTGTTLFGLFNLFFTGWTMKAFGVKKALLLTVFFPAVRLAVQNVGVEMGAGMGILVMQLSQIITVVGGPVGYLLALNSLATEVVEPAERTATLGRLSGCAMFGTALGYLIGGFVGDYFGIIWPFRLTVVLFLLSFLYIALCLPTIHNKEVEGRAARSLSGFFDPIKMFAPKKFLLQDGRTVRKEYGVLLLGTGTFLGVLSTSYIPVLLQMYSTDVFGFGTSENGVLISVNSLIRGFFLTLAFPVIISRGRKWLDKRSQSAREARITAQESGIPDLPYDPNTIAAAASRAMESAQEPAEPPKPADGEEESFHFDLVFTKYSLVADGLLTGLATFTTQGWQMYLIAVILPLASGTGPAAKGTILQMCPPEQRTDALSAISLVELMARLTSTSLFGLVFSAFAEVGQTHLTFTVNAAIAVVGFGILMFARFPPFGSTRFVKDADEDEGSDGGLEEET
ncbi:hypothetical protein LTR36_010491 [Oleoguttula mirabilis]|uniref:MFS general substrate transporter n=1 Tax=Oleoguttula mirabilis TaxID=1507867 RepID=A0AAV9J4N8_9PEZI|nr:hypothetical protein LTR36_010491 [Oleoguttula mirabilis]